MAGGKRVNLPPVALPTTVVHRLSRAVAVLHQGGKRGVLGSPERYGFQSVSMVVQWRQYSLDSLRDLAQMVNYLVDPRGHRRGPSLQRGCLSLLVQSGKHLVLLVVV